MTFAKYTTARPMTRAEVQQLVDEYCEDIYCFPKEKADERLKQKLDGRFGEESTDKTPLRRRY